MPSLDALVAAVTPLDAAAMAAARAHQDRLTKPAGALGRLEALAVHLAGITGSVNPSVARKAVVLCAADHGVAAQGVSAYPQEVTAQMVLNFLTGGAAINVLARLAGARVVVADLGVATALGPRPGLLDRRVAAGTADMTLGPAMTRDQAVAAILAGAGIVAAEAADGLDLVATGEMGIGNTTASSALVAVFTGAAPSAVTGRGTGVDDTAQRRKVAVVERALAVNRPSSADPLGALATVGGFEIAALAGVVLAAAGHRIPVVLDGFISGAAALAATSLCPAAAAYCIAGHRSAEPGHGAALAHLGLTPLLDLGLRLGEGSGAALAFPIIEAAARLAAEMATFDSAGVSQQTGPG